MREYAIVRTPLGVHIHMSRREVTRGDNAVGWAKTMDDARAEADALNAQHSDEIEAMRKMQLSLFDD